jgi:putative peptide zinc metalloprotease protein
MVEIRDDSKIGFANIFWRKESESYIVWKNGTSSFIELSESSFQAYKMLSEGKTPKETAKILINKYKKTYDTKEFVQELAKLGFVSTIDGISIPQQKIKKNSLAFLKKHHVQWIYSKPLLIVYLAFIFFSFNILIFNPVYLPKYTDFFFTDNYVITIGVSFAIGLGLIFLHELAHLTAGKAAGVEGNFGIGLRLYIPVAETNLTQLWKIPRNKRYMPFLAGMLNDLLLLSCFVIILWFNDFYPFFDLGVIEKLARLSILLLYYSLIWQFLLFIRTDLYYTISNFFGCRNLYSDSWAFLLKVFKRSKAIENKYSIPINELRVVRIYAPFMLLATVFAVLIFAVWGLPIFALIFVEGFKLLLTGLGGNSGFFVEGLILVCLIGIQMIGFFLFIFKALLRFKGYLKSTLASKNEKKYPI